jgi:hypothetical protein
MPPVGFEPKISVLERAKTVRALDRAATAIGSILLKNLSWLVLPLDTQGFMLCSVYTAVLYV